MDQGTKQYKMQRSWPKIILFGDSVTQVCFKPIGCWAAQIADYLKRRCDVINRGLSGYNTRWCKLALPKIITKDDAKETCLFAICLGANDALDSGICPAQHVPLAEFKQNMMAIVSYLLNIGIRKEKILIITPPPTVEDEWDALCKKEGYPSGKYNEPLKYYARACVEVAMEMNTELVDLFAAMENIEDLNPLFFDGCHLSNEGGQLLFDLMKPLLQKLKSELPIQLPFWLHPTDDLNEALQECQ